MTDPIARTIDDAFAGFAVAMGATVAAAIALGATPGTTALACLTYAVGSVAWAVGRVMWLGRRR